MGGERRGGYKAGNKRERVQAVVVVLVVEGCCGIITRYVGMDENQAGKYLGTYQTILQNGEGEKDV